MSPHEMKTLEEVEEFLSFFIAIPMEAICAMTEAETHTFSSLLLLL